MSSYKNIDDYINNFPTNVQANLQKLRKTIQQAAPEAGEKISYGIPTFTFHGNLVHFAAFNDHYSLFPGASGVAAFEKQLKSYETSKGTIKFPLDKPLPFNLVGKIVKFRVQQNQQRKKKR